jgi:hypothetical protein
MLCVTYLGDSMLFLRKALKLPSPVDLGWSDCDALQLREFTPDCEGYTWEDWHETIKKKYPIRYFFAETFPLFLKRKIWWKISFPANKFYYWVMCHIHPEHKFHLLDLRQPIDNKYNIDRYRYGWIDIPHKMLFAMFNLLKEYIDSDPYDISSDLSMDIINADSAYKEQYEKLKEAKDLLYWWEVTRKNDYALLDDMRTTWSIMHKNKEARQNGSADKLLDAIRDYESSLEKTAEEMLIRLVKIRSFMFDD